MIQHAAGPITTATVSVVALLSDLPLPSGDSWLKDGVAIGVLGLSMLWMIARTIPQMNKQNAKTIDDMCARFEERLAATAKAEHEDREQLNTTLQQLCANYAASQAHKQA